MNDPPGGQSALGIEAVEWFAEGGENLIVRVTGRWRRRRPAWGGQPVLVIEAQGRRQRFPAMPEPPSVTGTVPGTWRISFSVPAWLAPYLGGRTWLQFGAVVVALPMDVEPAGAPVGGAPPSGVAESEPPHVRQPLDPETLTARRLRSAELAADSARRRAAEAEDAAAELAARIEEFERELVQARRDAERLSALVAERERQQRAAQQLAHAEQSLRLELEEELAVHQRDSESAREALGELAAAEARARELEREIARLRRRADEAEQSAAAARAGRERAEREQAEREQAARELAEAMPGPVAIAPGDARSLAREREMAAHRAALSRRVPSEPSATFVLHGRGLPGAVAGPEPEPDPERKVAADALAHTVLALRRELETRASAEARLRAQLVAAHGRFEARLAAEGQLSATLAQLRQELDGLRGDVACEAAARSQAERRAEELEHELHEQRVRSERAYEAIEELRRTLDMVRAFRVAPPTAPDRAGPVEPERLSDALARLRETIAQEFTDEGGEEGGAGGTEVLAPAPDAPAPEGSAAQPAIEPSATQAPGEPEAPAAVQPRPPEAPEPEPPAAGAPTTPDPEPPAAGAPTTPDPEPPAAPTPAAPDPEPHTAGAESAGKPWLEPVIRALAKRDAAAAGRLLVGLLPAQRAAYPRPVAYDLVLGAQSGCVQVTVRDGAPLITVSDGPRQLREVDFQAVGGPPEIVALLTAGRLRRRFGRGVARVRGDRDGLAALRGLVRTPLHLRELHAAGVRLDPALALTVVSLMIEPAWTAGERFTIAYQAADGTGARLEVRDGGPLTVADSAPEGPVATTIACPADALLLVLAGERPAELAISGEERPLALMVEWIKRAQSG